jgi:3-oxoacyl-(acyl-carrier-protein) synthase
MRRVVITGIGIVSSLGDTAEDVLVSLQKGKSGIRYWEPYNTLGLRSQIGAFTKINCEKHIDKKILRFMGQAAAYAYIAMRQAVRHSGLRPEQVSSPRTGLIIGSGGTSAENVVATADTMRNRGLRRLSPFMVPRTMSSTVSAGLTAPFKIKGTCYSISSACATGAHCIGAAMEQIRGATIHGELIGYGATADGHEMVAPSGEGAARCIAIALEAADRTVDYINTHGTSTPIGDMIELQAIRHVFGDSVPLISSTKSLSGHSLGAAGVHEVIYSLLMLNNNFIAATANIDHLEPEAKDMNIVQETQQKKLDSVMSSSYGFGGTNACLIFQKYPAA